jgi:sugar/nucleoside kinase (ribokinase family)
MAPRYPQRGEFDIVHVGNVCRDVAPDDPRGWRLGGGVAYAALTSARLGLRTAALIGADGIAAGAAEFDLLRAAGVTMRIVPLARGPVFDNVETPGGRVQTCLDPGEPLPIVAVPGSWAAAPAWLVVPVAGETGPGWAGAVPPGARLALGWQGLLRKLVAGRRTIRRPLVASPLVTRADLVGVSRHDLAPGTRLEALIELLHPGARLIVTEGPSGGLLVMAGPAGTPAVLRYRAVAAAQGDPTGAGDVFLAALVAAGSPAGASPVDGWLSEAAFRWAAAASSLVVEGPGLGAVPTRADVLARLDREPSGPWLGPVIADGNDT